MAEAPRRLFFALWPAAAVAGELDRLAREVQRACGGRATRRDSLHLTLAFLGDVPADRVSAAEAAADAVAGGRFLLELDRLACWKHNRIVWAGCERTPAALADLAAGLGDNLRAAGFVLDARPFAVHATLVRNADCRVALPPLQPPLHWQVDDFALIESRLAPGGSRYAIVRRWPLH
ncbi:MAG TPA: RNA 2',3'-cyclic phosphodiesterase [Rhodocyclaceae bacterium]